MRQFYQRCTFALVVLLGSLALPSYAVAADVFLVYVGADKSTQKSVKKILPEDLKIKSYNASLLAMADYSEKQKAVAKVTKAKLVVFITAKPKELLGDPSIANSVTVESDSQTEIDKILQALR